MLLNSVISKYIQKSRIFLYPLLKIKRGISVTPIQTYMAWEGKYGLDENMFITVYHKREDREYKNFERGILLNNDYFHDCFLLENNIAVYVFNFDNLDKDYHFIRRGKYSLISDLTKKKILYFFRTHKRHHRQVESYLFPKKYFDTYSKILDVNTNLLESVGELCSKPKLNQEILRSQNKILNLENINFNIPNGKDKT